MTTPDALLVTVETFLDYEGEWTTAWICYFRNRILTVEYTPGRSALTRMVEFNEAA